MKFVKKKNVKKVVMLQNYINRFTVVVFFSPSVSLQSLVMEYCNTQFG